jgi:hypothetical protein
LHFIATVVVGRRAVEGLQTRLTGLRSVVGMWRALSWSHYRLVTAVWIGGFRGYSGDAVIGGRRRDFCVDKVPTRLSMRLSWQHAGIMRPMIVPL